MELLWQAQVNQSPTNFTAGTAVESTSQSPTKSTGTTTASPSQLPTTSTIEWNCYSKPKSIAHDIDHRVELLQQAQVNHPRKDHRVELLQQALVNRPRHRPSSRTATASPSQSPTTSTGNASASPSNLPTNLTTGTAEASQANRPRI